MKSLENYILETSIGRGGRDEFNERTIRKRLAQKFDEHKLFDSRTIQNIEYLNDFTYYGFKFQSNSEFNDYKFKGYFAMTEIEERRNKYSFITKEKIAGSRLAERYFKDFNDDMVSTFLYFDFTLPNVNYKFGDRNWKDENYLFLCYDMKNDEVHLIKYHKSVEGSYATRNGKAKDIPEELLEYVNNVLYTINKNHNKNESPSKWIDDTNKR